MSLRPPYHRYALALALLAGLACPAGAQNYDPDNEDFVPLSTMGTVEFFINLSTLEVTDEDKGQLDFDVIWYTLAQRDGGGYNRGRNRMNCLQGLYYRSPF